MSMTGALIESCRMLHSVNLWYTHKLPNTSLALILHLVRAAYWEGHALT